MNCKVLVFSGYGLNCEKETLEAFEFVGFRGDIYHISDVVKNPSMISKYQVIAIPGGFSFGDCTGSGNALALKIKSKMIDVVDDFKHSGGLVIGICNGCQVLTRFLPEFNFTLEPNVCGEYVCRWSKVVVEKGTKSVWMRGLDNFNLVKKLPIAHAEGRFFMDDRLFKKLEKEGLIALRYASNGNFNGSVGDVAAVCDESGRILCIMPHPERAMFDTQLEDWCFKVEQERRGNVSCSHGFGYHIFKNAYDYFN